MKRRIGRLLLLMALGLFGESRAWAELVDFQYEWSILPSTVIARGTGSVNFALVPGTDAQATLDVTTPVRVKGFEVTTSGNPASVPDEYDAIGVTVQLKLTDTASGAHGQLTFMGTLNGTLTSTDSTLTIEFFDPRSQQITLDGRTYTAAITPTINLDIPSSTEVGMLDALVTVSSQSTNSTPITPIPTPEPSSLLLGVTALAGLTARHWLRCRR